MNGWLAEYPEVHGGQQPLPCPPARPVSSCGPSHGPRASATPHFDPDWPSNIGRRCCIISPGSCWFESELSLSCFCSQREISCAAVCCALMPYAEVKHGHRCFSQLEQEILSDMAINSFSVHEAWCPHKDTCLILLVKKVKRPTGTPKNWDGAGNSREAASKEQKLCSLLMNWEAVCGGLLLLLLILRFTVFHLTDCT